MSFETEFLHMMPETVVIYPYVGQDSWGKKTWGAGSHYRARITGKGTTMRRAMQQDEAVIYDVYTDGVPVTPQDRMPIQGGPVGVFTVNDKVTLPPDIRWEDQEPEVFAIGRYTDEQSFHHYLIQLGFMYHRQTA